jgi:hypothetical protein
MVVGRWVHDGYTLTAAIRENSAGAHEKMTYDDLMISKSISILAATF